MSEKRRDNRNRILREGEYQRKDGRYRFRYIDEDGKEKNVYGTINPYLSVLVVWEKSSLLHRVSTHFHIIEFIVFK